MSNAVSIIGRIDPKIAAIIGTNKFTEQLAQNLDKYVGLNSDDKQPHDICKLRFVLDDNGTTKTNCKKTMDSKSTIVKKTMGEVKDLTPANIETKLSEMLQKLDNKITIKNQYFIIVYLPHTVESKGVLKGSDVKGTKNGQIMLVKYGIDAKKPEWVTIYNNVDIEKNKIILGEHDKYTLQNGRYISDKIENANTARQAAVNDAEDKAKKDAGDKDKKDAEDKKDADDKAKKDADDKAKKDADDKAKKDVEDKAKKDAMYVINVAPSIRLRDNLKALTKQQQEERERLNTKNRTMWTTQSSKFIQTAATDDNAKTKHAQTKNNNTVLAKTEHAPTKKNNNNAVLAKTEHAPTKNNTETDDAKKKRRLKSSQVQNKIYREVAGENARKTQKEKNAQKTQKDKEDNARKTQKKDKEDKEDNARKKTRKDANRERAAAYLREIKEEQREDTTQNIKDLFKHQYEDIVKNETKRNNFDRAIGRFIGDSVEYKKYKASQILLMQHFIGRYNKIHDEKLDEYDDTKQSSIKNTIKPHLVKILKQTDPTFLSNSGGKSTRKKRSKSTLKKGGRGKPMTVKKNNKGASKTRRFGRKNR